jgi:LmbE family N-acetylglucosaminyl deacetylase
MAPMRILSIHAHPDDAELLAGGTLALLAQSGHEIVIATMTPGDCGSKEAPPDEISSIRRREGAAAASIIGAAYRCLEFRDLAVFNDLPSRVRVTHFLRQARPDLVLTASPIDYMADHEAASSLVRDALFGAPAPNYARENSPPALDKIPHLYFMDSVGGVDRDGAPIPPDFVVDVSSTFETKKKLFAAHASQREWLLKHHGMDDYMMQMEEWTRTAGARVNLPLGEGFRRYKGHPYPQTPLLEELLGRKVTVPQARVSPVA